MIPTLATVTTIVCLVMDCKEETTQTASTIAATTEEINTEVTIQTRKYTRHEVLDANDIYHFYWQPPEDRNPDSEIYFKVEVRKKGYIGIGFSPNGGMPGSDIFTGWIRDGKPFYQDRHATKFGLPSNDTRQDYKVLNAYENDTFTVFEFSRKLDTCDENDRVIEEGNVRLIYAYSEEDPEDGDPFYHGNNRGTKSVILLQNKMTEEQDLTSTLHWDITMSDIDISSYDSIYWCKVFKAPELSEKHHIVQVSPLIQEGHEEFIHHVTLFKCTGGTPDSYEKDVDGKGVRCDEPPVPDVMITCQENVVGWAIGATDLVFPDYAGLPLDPASSKYYMFQVHYSNQQLQKGIIDNSGIRLYYTPNLRKFDAGKFQIGASISPRVIIPPGQEEFVVASHSDYDCIGSAFPDSGVKAFAFSPHTHLLGRKFKARHFRGNQELPPLSDEQYYDFNYQEYRFYEEEVDILPNDQITVECTYDSSERRNVTLGGLSTKEEMCLAMIFYYPAVDQHNSYSSPSYATINEVLKTNVKQDSDIYDELEIYDWATVDIDEMQNVFRYSEQPAHCLYGLLPEETPLVKYPADLVPYEKESKCNVTAH